MDRRSLVVAFCVVGCAASTPPPEPCPEPVAQQVADRAGFLLEQLKQRTAERDAALAANAVLKDQLAAAKAERRELSAKIAELEAEKSALVFELSKAHETIRVRGKQIVNAFSKGHGCESSLASITAERDECYVRLAEQMMPKPAR